MVERQHRLELRVRIPSVIYATQYGISMKSVSERFMEKVRITEAGCWEWQGSIQKGYGFWCWKRAHRISWEMHRGPIPLGLHVCHKCDNPPCVNPDHLWLGTPRDNANDRDAKGRGRTYIHPVRSECPKGHAYTPENTAIYGRRDRKTKARRCLQCRTEMLARKKGRHTAFYGFSIGFLWV